MVAQAFPVKKEWDEARGKWSKKPDTGGASWLTYRTTPEQIESSDNIGVIIPSGVIVVDVDEYKGATTAAIDAALGASLPWSDALLQVTVSGGKHYAFTLPDGVTVRQGSDLLGITGFDTRASGKGWICTGDGYKSETFLPVQDALTDWPWPMLPLEAIERLRDSPTANAAGTDLDLLSAAVAAQPLDDIGITEIVEVLRRLPEGTVEKYQPWLDVGMGIHHQTSGSLDGFKIWVAWSKTASTYDLEECKDKWRSFGKRLTDSPITFATVIRMAGGGAAKVSEKHLLQVIEDEIADAEEPREGYFSIRDKVKAIPAHKMGEDVRSMVAKMLAERFGEATGLTASKIVKALQPEKKRSEKRSDVDAPDWLEQWIYVESTCEFYNVELDYAIKREAFNAKFDRETECESAEMSASQYALTVAKIQTVVDIMYWPGAEQMFEHEGKTMLNRYRDRGVPIVQEDQHGVVGRFLKHVELTLPDQADREILLDWLCFICQNPGKRINWALLLQGAQGTGKTYFVNVLQRVLGSNVTCLDPQAIAGRFTGWAHGSVAMAIEEIRIHGTNKYEILDRMKPFLTNDTVSIEEKGRDHRTVPNFTSYLLLTNHLDAIPLADGDRRYCVLYSHWQSEGQMFDELGGRLGAEKYFDALFGDLNVERVGSLAYYLKTRKISDSFSPRGRAPETKARQRMINLAISPERQMLEDAISEHKCPVINEHILDLTWLNELCKKDGPELPGNRAITAILLDMGYEQYEKRKIKISKTRRNHYIWLGRGSDTSFEPQVVREFHDDPNFIPF